MKNIYKLSFLFLIITYLLACSDNKPDPNPNPGNGDHDHSESTVQSWICKELCEWYLWNTDIQAKTPNYDLDYDSFFYSLLSTNRNDGKSKGKFYSYITRKNSSTRIDQSGEYSFGMSVVYSEFYVRKNNTVSLELYAVVTYVVEDSPAWNAGIRRGHFIKSINNTELNLSNYETLNRYILSSEILGNTPAPVKITAYKVEWDGKDVYNKDYAVGHIVGNALTVDLTPDAVIDNPCHYYNTYEVDGIKVGYLVYNMFERGDSYEFDDKMKKIFKEFKNEGIKELVLDLRYNGGGYVSSCQLLSSMIAPENKLGTVFQKMTYNESITKKYGESYFWINFLKVSEMSDPKLHYGVESGTNLNLSKLYVIATQFSASASEALINCLEGVDMNVYHIGGKTEGKNVGMTSRKSKAYDGYTYEMYPVTFYSNNAKGEADFEKGFEPDSPTYSEFGNISFPEFGDYEKDEYLNMAFYHIAMGRFPETSRSIVEPKAGKILLSTFDYRRKGMIMDME